MKILKNSTYEDLQNQIKQAEASAKDNNKKYNSMKLRKEGLEEELKVASIKLERCKKELEVQTTENKQNKESLLSANKGIEELSKKYKNICDSKGGLTKQNNKLKKENIEQSKLIDDLNKKIENFKNELKKFHKPKTINEYDHKYKTYNKKEKIKL